MASWKIWLDRATLGRTLLPDSVPRPWRIPYVLVPYAFIWLILGTAAGRLISTPIGLLLRLVHAPFWLEAAIGFPLAVLWLAWFVAGFVKAFAWAFEREGSPPSPSPPRPQVDRWVP